MLIKQIGAGSTEKFQLNYVPERLLIIAQDGNSEIRNQVSVKVTPLGVGVICDLDGIGVARVDAFNKIGGFYDGACVAMELPLADGLVPDRVTDYEIRNDNEEDILIYAPISKKATLYVKSMQQTLLANSQVIFDKFLLISVDRNSENDQFTVDYEDGSTHTYSGRELSKSNTKTSSSNVPSIYNPDGRIRKVTVIPGAQITGYKVAYMNL